MCVACDHRAPGAPLLHIHRQASLAEFENAASDAAIGNNLCPLLLSDAVLQVPTVAVGLCQVLQVCSQHRPCQEWHCPVLDGCLLQSPVLTAGAGLRLLTCHCMLGSMLWCVELGPVVRGLLDCATHQQLAAASTGSKGSSAG